MKKILSVLVFLLCCCPIYSHAAWYDSELAELQKQNFISEVHFQNPDNPILREEICDILVSLYKHQNPDKEIKNKANSFADIQNSAFKNSIENAYSLGMIQGVSNTEFQGQGTLTREQFATIIYRMHGSPMSIVRVYEDFNKISEYALSAIDYCIEQEILKGTAKGYFSPKTKLTKAEALVIVNRLSKLSDISSEKSVAKKRTSVLEDKDYIYYLATNGKGIVQINKNNNTREIFSLTSPVVNQIYDMGTYIYLPKASTSSYGSVINYVCSEGGYIFDKKSFAVKEISTPITGQPFASYEDCIYYVEKAGDRTEHLIEYNLKTNKKTISQELFPYDFLSNSEILRTVDDKVYIRKSRDGVNYEYLCVNLATLTSNFIPESDVYKFTLKRNEQGNGILSVYDTATNKLINNYSIDELFPQLKYNMNISFYTGGDCTWLADRETQFYVGDDIYIYIPYSQKAICITDRNKFDIDMLSYHLTENIDSAYQEDVYDYCYNLSEFVSSPMWHSNSLASYNKDSMFLSLYTRDYFADTVALDYAHEDYQISKNFCKSYVDNYGTPYEIISAINEYLTYNCVHYDRIRDTITDKSRYSATSHLKIITEKTGMCNAFANTIQEVLNEAGIKNMVISGTLFGEPHAWNMVELDGKKYFIDATYNAAFVDPNAMFMVSYDKISQTHHANSSYLPYIK